MVSGQLVAGVVNTDHKGMVLADDAILTTLQLKSDKLISLDQFGPAPDSIPHMEWNGHTFSSQMQAPSPHVIISIGRVYSLRSPDMYTWIKPHDSS